MYGTLQQQQYGTATIARPNNAGYYGGFGGLAQLATQPYTVGTTTVAAQPRMMTPQPVVTTMAPSVVQQPVVTTTAPSVVPQAIPQAVMPGPPPKLTAGIPTPEQIAAQKAQYAAALDKQLEEARNTVVKETKIQQEMAKFTADKQTDLYRVQVEEKTVEAVSRVEEQATIQSLELKKALVERNLQLDSQAAGMTMDYRMKELMTACAMKQYQFQQQYVNAENKLAQQYNQAFVKAGGVGV